MKVHFLVLAGLAASLTLGCATPKVKPKLAEVEIIGDLGIRYNGTTLEPQFDPNVKPQGDCNALGAVSGQDSVAQGTPRELGVQIRMLTEAKNNIRKNAAAMGANVVHLQSARRATPDSMMVSGIAYKCVK